jgi:integrase
VEAVYRVLKKIMRMAVEQDDLLVKSPCIPKLPKADDARPFVVPTYEEVHTMLEGIYKPYRAAVAVAVETGMRQGEIFGLTLANVNMIGRMINVDHQLLTPPLGGACVFGPPKTPSSRRELKVTEWTMMQLARHLERYPITHEMGVIFTCRLGGPVRRHTIAEAWAKARQSLGVRHSFRFHDLRHYHASVLIAEGADPVTVSKRLGHARVSETLDIYSHEFDKRRRDKAVIEMIDRHRDQAERMRLTGLGS